ncbi:MAG: class I SAM-dependent methyltransferase [Candidatus Eisenbacteria bacterium]|nr:class I SAM-dependent methyltransferase [Candidatus Eisenbacteria bacterium]
MPRTRTPAGPAAAYDTFARVYDAWQSGYPRPFAEAIFPFYEREIERRGAPHSSIADLACGTGGFLRLWAARHPGWRLYGTDLSSGMLSAARRNLRAEGAPARLRLASLQATRLPEPVGAAVCVFDGVNHLTRTRDLERCFRSVARSVLPRGLFLFDLNEETSFARLFEGSWAVDAPGLHVEALASATKDGGYGTLRFRIFRARRSFGWTLREIAIRERNWRRPLVERALRESGWIVLRVRRIDPYPRAEVEAPRTLWICKRGPGRPGRTASQAGAIVPRIRPNAAG